MTEGKTTMRQWPDNICAGPIRYEPAANYEGFALMDASHGIPTFAAVGAAPEGTRVHVFNYPGQTEAIAKRLVNCWNAHDDLVTALQGLLEVCPCRNGCAPDDMTCATNKARAALTKAGAREST